jgi:hypothetical protein
MRHSTIIQPRKDRLTAVTVEQGISMQHTSTTRSAAGYLAAYGVPFDVALRVLTTPYRRDIGALLAAAPSWREIILAAGPTYGGHV